MWGENTIQSITESKTNIGLNGSQGTQMCMILNKFPMLNLMFLNCEIQKYSNNKYLAHRVIE